MTHRNALRASILIAGAALVVGIALSYRCRTREWCSECYSEAIRTSWHLGTALPGRAWLSIYAQRDIRASPVATDFFPAGHTHRWLTADGHCDRCGLFPRVTFDGAEPDNAVAIRYDADQAFRTWIQNRFRAGTLREDRFRRFLALRRVPSGELILRLPDKPDVAEARDLLRQADRELDIVSSGSPGSASAVSPDEPRSRAPSTRISPAFLMALALILFPAGVGFFAYGVVLRLRGRPMEPIPALGRIVAASRSEITLEVLVDDSRLQLSVPIYPPNAEGALPEELRPGGTIPVLCRSVRPPVLGVDRARCSDVIYEWITPPRTVDLEATLIPFSLLVIGVGLVLMLTALLAFVIARR